MITKIEPFQDNPEIDLSMKGKYGLFSVARYENDDTAELYFCDTEEEANKQYEECLTRGRDVYLRSKKQPYATA